ncbi:MAG: diguanylate cyclase, partial [Pseudomonadota bacterium]|nr:diguanylate cyclase [Pseudomonadota bacterium]
GRITHFVGVREDITLRKHQEDDLSFQANYDTLTNLPNRLSALDRLRQAIAHAQRNHNRVALLFLDLDHFKHINDTLGHDAGDEVLKLLATRLGNCLRDSDTLARLGGDEFLLVLPDLAEAAQAESVARKLLLAANSPLLVQQQTVRACTETICVKN